MWTSLSAMPNAEWGGLQSSAALTIPIFKLNHEFNTEMSILTKYCAWNYRRQKRLWPCWPQSSFIRGKYVQKNILVLRKKNKSINLICASPWINIIVDQVDKCHSRAEHQTLDPDSWTLRTFAQWVIFFSLPLLCILMMADNIQPIGITTTAHYSLWPADTQRNKY